MIDHVAHPSFDAGATHQYYTGVLGARLRAAMTGDSPQWNARYLLAAYEVEGAELDFFSYVGIVRPNSDGLPHDIRHVGIAVDSDADLTRIRAQLDEHAAPYWVETHAGPDDLHVYATDPNGLVLEFSVAGAPWNARPDSYEQLRAWIESTTN